MPVNIPMDPEVRQRFIETLGIMMQPNPAGPITELVATLESKHRNAITLLKHMLATLMLEGNQHLFAQMPEDWRLLVKSWYEQYQTLEGANE